MSLWIMSVLSSWRGAQFTGVTMAVDLEPHSLYRGPCDAIPALWLAGYSERRTSSVSGASVVSGCHDNATPETSTESPFFSYLSGAGACLSLLHGRCDTFNLINTFKSFTHRIYHAYMTAGSERNDKRKSGMEKFEVKWLLVWCQRCVRTSSLWDSHRTPWHVRGTICWET